MPKVYGFNNGGSYGWMQAIAISEDGVILAAHTCSSESWMPHDLGMDGSSDWKHEEYRKYYPSGFETEFVPSDAIDSHSGLQRAFELGKAAAEKVEGAEAQQLTNVCQNASEKAMRS